MAEENKNLVPEESEKKVEKTKEKANKKPNFLVRAWRKICKLCKDIVGEMKKVVWTSKEELFKNTKIVLATVVAVGLAIAVVDTLFSWLINTIAGLIG